jgi:hypothetical protein
MLIDIRRPLHAPTEFPSDDKVARARAYLDGQSRIDLAVWVRHEQRGVDGPLYDHHMMLGLADDDYENADPDAILFGLEREMGYLGGWTDLFPLSEVETLREVGHILWERDGRPIEGLDPLDFRWSFEATPLPEGLRAVIEAAVEDLPAVMGIEVTQARLWKAGREVWTQARVFVIADEARGHVRNVVTPIAELLAPYFPLNRAVSLGRPVDPRVETTTLFSRAAEPTP